MHDSDYGDNASPDVQEVSFKPATGGMISETRRKISGGKFGPDWKHETAVHGNINHAVKHLKAMFGKAVVKKENGITKNGGLKKSASMRKG